MSSFNCGGKLGDFIHSLYAVKHLCKQDKGIVYLSAEGDAWAYGLERAFEELRPVMSVQPYVGAFSLLKWKCEDSVTIDMNSWRKVVAKTHAETGKYDKCWSELMAETYGFSPPDPKDYDWLTPTDYDPDTVGKVVIHHSLRHHGSLDWNARLEGRPKGDVLFVTSNRAEYDEFKHKHLATLYLVKTIEDMVNAIASCECFVGNQSAPLAIATALDVPRVAELNSDPAPFYMGETRYSNNFAWHL